MTQRDVDVMAGERARAIRAGVRVPIVDPTDPRSGALQPLAEHDLDPTRPRADGLEQFAEHDLDPTDPRAPDEAA